MKCPIQKSTGKLLYLSDFFIELKEPSKKQSPETCWEKAHSLVYKKIKFWSDLSIHNLTLDYLLLKHQVRVFEYTMKWCNSIFKNV